MLSLHPHPLTRRLSVLMVLLFALTGAAAHPDLDGGWTWPVQDARVVVSPFRAPAHAYGPGHRGIDLSAPPGAIVRAPADGVVAFRGVVVDRPLLTIDHGDGLVSTFEPLDSALTSGTAVRTGDEIGTVATGGHAPRGSMHLGVRLNKVYINAMLLFDEVPRAILLPCCKASTRAGAPVGMSP